MLINKDINRLYRFLLSFVLTIIVTGGVMASSGSGYGYLAFLDSLATSSIQGHEQGYKQVLYGAISFLASPKMDILWIVIIAFFLWTIRYRIPAVWALATLLSGNVVGVILKKIVQRPRPLLHSAADTGFSYPSGHVLGTVLVVSVIWVLLIPMLKNRRTQIVAKTIAVIYVILVMMSRVFLNAHYPSDTVGALLVGYTWFQFCEWLYYHYAGKLNRYHPFQKSIY
ncbi:phosphatase PAP2 family protein [Nicoliella spurrieriana]|uniref:Phosphatase PAP2 family protein n=1 Tax=Nicoliella spurrieriana TaxID=2925830 RepID=A0A976RR96_9LACO|nr:phosphatase PAP2 family protein [Nicoliella spurrieriana]UQS86333.1 phosphatase PAP2 family protein [Nicoliella spurrieriana]